MKDYEEVIGLIVPPFGFTIVALLSFQYFFQWRLDEFKTWQLILGALHLTLATAMYILTAIKDDPWEVPVRLSYNRWEVHEMSECSETQPCSIYLENEELEYPLKTTYLVPIYSIISGLHHFIAAISLGRNDGFYKNQIFGGINVVRWLDYALSSSLMLVVLELLFLSPPDLRMLFYTAFFQMLIIGMGYASDIARKSKQFGHALTLFGIATVLYAGFYSLQILVFAKGTEASDAPSIVYIFVAYIIFTFSLFAVVQGWYTFKDSKLDANKGDLMGLRFRQEVWFSFLSFFSKYPLLVSFYFGLTTRSSAGIQVRETPKCNETTTTISMAGTSNGTAEFLSFLPFILSTLFCIIIGCIMLYCNPGLDTFFFRTKTPTGSTYSRL